MPVRSDPTRAAAFQCALLRAGEATAADLSVELLHADADAEPRASRLASRLEAIHARYG